MHITPEQYEIARLNGIGKKNVENRVWGHGWTVERAITQPLRGVDVISTEKEFFGGAKSG